MKVKIISVITTIANQMKSNLIFIFLLSLTVCMAKIMPSTKKEEFVKLMFLGDMVNYLNQNPLKTANCYNDIKNDYKEAINYFKIQMRNTASSVKDLFSALQFIEANEASTAVSKLEKIGEKMLQYEKDMRNAFEKKTELLLENAKLYTVMVKKDVESFYDEYLSTMKYFDNRANRGEERVKNHIAERREPFLNTLRAHTNWFKMCMEKNFHSP